MIPRWSSTLPALILFAAALAGTSLSAAPPLPSRPTRYATDQAGTFSPARLGALNERLAAFERETSNQVLVYVDRRVPAGTTLEEMSTASVRAWGIGQKDKRNGVVLFVFVDDRKMRIEVGYGLEGALPDAAAHRITDGVIKPHFRKGDYAAGIEAGADAILARLRTEGNRGSGVTAAEKARGVKPGGVRPREQPGVVQPRVAIPPHVQPQAAAAQTAPLSFRWLWPLIALAPLLAWPFLRSLVRAIAWGALSGSIACFIAAVASLQATWAVFGVLLGLVSGVAFLVWRVQQPGWTPPVRDTSVASGDSWSSSDSSDSSSSPSSSDSGSSSSDFSGGGGDSGGGGSSDSW